MNDNPIEGITDTQEAQAEAFARLVKRVEQLETLEVGGAADYILIQDQKAPATDGGTFTSGAWRTRDLNTIVNNDGGYAALAANQITLQAGMYEVSASAPAYSVYHHQARLHNVTDAISYLGSTEFSSGATESRSVVECKFNIATAKVFELQHRCLITFLGYGFGVGAGASWGANIFSIVAIRRVG